MSVQSTVHHDRRCELRACVSEYLHPTDVESAQAREGRLFLKRIAFHCTPLVVLALAAFAFGQHF